MPEVLPMNFLFLTFFYQSNMLSSRTVDGHQMYFGGSVVSKASTIDEIDREISPIPPLIFIGGQKVRNLVWFKTLLNFEPPAFENVVRYWNFETNRNAAMIALCPGQVW